MEIGPLSEWVTAVAEILAVCTALFLPYLNQARSARRRQRKFNRTITHLTEAILTGDNDAKRQLEMFLNVSFLSSTSAKEEDSIQVGFEILPLLSDKTANQAQINQLLDQLK